MEPPDVFTVRDLRDRPEDLLRDAEQGRMAIITKDGRPAMLAIPFDLRLLEHGVHRALALHLFESEQCTLGQSAKLAGLSIGDFIDLLGPAGIPVLRYSPDELEDELKAAR